MDDLSKRIQSFNKVRFHNRLLLIIFTTYSIGLVIFTLVNEDQDSLFEHIFLFIVALASMLNYFVLIFAKPVGKDEPDNKKKLLDQYEDMTHRSNYLYLGYLQPVVLGDFAILIFELRFSPYFFLFLTVLLLLAVFTVLRLEFSKRFCSKSFEEISGKKLILLFP